MIKQHEIKSRFKKFGLILLEKYTGCMTRHKFRCSCGKIFKACPRSVFRGDTKSCGCLVSPDLTGRRFGKLKVIERTKKEINLCLSFINVNVIAEIL